MLLHVPTLTLATLAVSTILSLLMVLTWLQDRDEPALLYWAPAGFAGAVGMMILANDGALLSAGSIVISQALFIVWAGLTWCGARRFAGRPAQVEWVGAAVTVWVVLSQTAILDDMVARVASASVLRAVLVGLAVFEFWRGRDERLLSRWAAIAALGIHVCGLLARIPVLAFADLPPDPAIFQTGWLGLAAMGQLLYTTAITFVLLALTKERAEVRHRRAARTDSLTALLNRGAFKEEARACLSGGSPYVAALVFDLDKFKSINDRFGHATGDRVLQRFAATLRAELRHTDIVGRLGGEEFAALLPDGDPQSALETAERIRRVFSAGAGSEEPYLTATVSIGAAIAIRSRDLDALLAEADRAVYLAKRAGRDCVRLAGAAAMPEAAKKPAASSVAA
jgi:diguanylate cyclase (GGDEF)-like protein